MAREVLKGIKSENRLSKVRLIMPNDPVIGGQPSDNADEFTSNTPFLDLACSIQYAVTQAANANTAAKNADTKAVNAQTTANTANTAAKNADTKAVAAQKTADEAKTAAATADGKAVAAQNTANTANTAAKNADTKAGTAQTTANQAKTAAATADSKAVAAQKTADEAKTAAATADSKAVAAQNTANTANTAAKNADTKAANAQTTATGAKTAADNAQKKANQVPNPLLDQLPIGASGTAYKLITLADLKAKLGVPAATKLYSGTGQATDGAMTQKAVTDIVFGVGQSYQDVSAQRLKDTVYTNNTKKVIEVRVEMVMTQHLSGSRTLRAWSGDKRILNEIFTQGQVDSSVRLNFSFLVPPGSTYSISTIGGEISQWMEFR